MYPKYPIYTFNARWSQLGVQDPKYPKWYEGLSEGRTWSGTGFSKMFKEEQTQEQIDEYIKKWWVDYCLLKSKNEKYPMQEVADVTLTAKYKEHETWVLDWFQHSTFDVGQSDAEALDSFEQFVRRYEHQQGINYETKTENYHCLMGAEDRWRWKGASPDGVTDDGNEYPAPCRCKYCKEQGLIRIGH